jgi:ABC-2 type transport system ATP-binding protein
MIERFAPVTRAAEGLMADAVIRTENLTRVFGETRAVDDLTLEVPAGIVFGFLGPNGAGKTTAIRLFLGLLEPTSGRATVLGADTRTASDAVRNRAGALLEHSGLYERLSAEDNLQFYGRVWGIDAQARQARVKELLGPLGLWERRGEMVGQWSRGMKQKLAVARALFHRPSLLFLDEPTAGLDPVASAALRDDLSAMVAREGVTVFLTTHNLVEAERLCHLVAVIKKGRLMAVGHPDELKASHATRAEITGRGFTADIVSHLRARPEVTGVELRNGRLLVELHSDSSTAPLVSLLVHEGVAVEEVRRDTGSLEEVFLTLMEEEQ